MEKNIYDLKTKEGCELWLRANSTEHETAEANLSRIAMSLQTARTKGAGK